MCLVACEKSECYRDPSEKRKPDRNSNRVYWAAGKLMMDQLGNYDESRIEEYRDKYMERFQ